MVTMQPREQPPPVQNQNFRGGQVHNVHQVTEGEEKGKQGCFQCGKSHPIFQCPDLVKMRAIDRTKYFRKHGLCYMCLGQHLGRPCKVSVCPRCQGPHNSFLCFKKENDRLKREREAEGGGAEHANTSSRENTSGGVRERVDRAQHVNHA